MPKVRIWRTDVYQPNAYDPTAAVGIVGVRQDDGTVAATGSCFRFGHDHVVLTARHCVQQEARTAVRFLHGGQIADVDAVIDHPMADLAVLLIHSGRPAPERARLAFTEIGRSGWPGEPFMAYGFPVEGPGFDDVGHQPVARVLSGTHQRFYVTTQLGYRYRAGEMSIAAPEGLSGGPIFSSHNPSAVTAMVTSNVESYRIAASIDEIDRDGVRQRIESRNVITYGVSLILGDHRDWLRDAIPWRDVSGADPPGTLMPRTR